VDFSKPDPANVDRFNRALPNDPLVERKKMFGFPAAFVNGNFFVGLHGQKVVARLPGGIKEQLPELAASPIFDPMETGKGMKDWWEVPQAITEDERRLASFFAAALERVALLPPKEAKPKKPRR
jgi:TfoX/Sxy family transcriptional regulator of competence genes